MKLEGRIKVGLTNNTWGLKDENQKTLSRKEHYRIMQHLCSYLIYAYQ